MHLYSLTGAVEKCVTTSQYQEMAKEQEVWTQSFLLILSGTGFGQATYFLAGRYVYKTNWNIFLKAGGQLLMFPDSFRCKGAQMANNWNVFLSTVQG